METIGIHGIIELYDIPDEWTDEEFDYWWCPQTAASGRILVPARMSDGEKRSRLVKRTENLIMNNGITLILNNLAVSGQGNMQPLAQILSVGNGALTGVTRSDTAVVGDGFATGSRKVPASFSSTGFSTTITTNFAATDAMGTWTNIGLYGFNPTGAQNATTTAGTGQLITHALFSFIKGSSAYALNYVFLLSN